jgi:hypothetical protein
MGEFMPLALTLGVFVLVQVVASVALGRHLGSRMSRLESQTARLQRAIENAAARQNAESDRRPLDPTQRFRSTSVLEPVPSLTIESPVESGDATDGGAAINVPAIDVPRSDDAPLDAIVAAPPFSLDLVRELYRRWTRERRRPPLPDTVAASPLRFAGSSRTNDWSPTVHALQDHPQIGEFIRFSDTEERQAFVLPDPGASFSQLVHPLLFPELTAEAYGDPSQLSAVAPLQLRRRDARTWEALR